MAGRQPQHSEDSNGRSFLRRVFKRKVRTRPEDVVLRVARKESDPPATAPLVVVACEHCGFDYQVTRIGFDDGTVGAIWACACGSRYIPPGGGESFSLVRR